MSGPVQIAAGASDQGLPGSIADLGGTPPAAGVVELTVPVESDLLVLARLAVSTIAARSSFDIEEIDDLRLAVDELCLSVLRGRRTGRLHLVFVGEADRIKVRCDYLGSDPDAEPADDGDPTGELSARILDALVDEHGPASDAESAGWWLRKLRAPRDE